MEGKYADEVMEYVNGCISGKINANHYRVLACHRFLQDLPRYDFKPDDADFVIFMIEHNFCHQQGEDLKGNPLRGKPFILQPFHKFIIYNLLGLYRKGTKIRKYNEALIFLPRKNVKTTFSGALAWALGLLERASGSKVYVVAASQKQTLETFGFVKYNIENMKEDTKHGGHFKIKDNSFEHTISAKLGDGMFQLTALASNPDAQDSFNCNIAIADEIHAFKKPKQYNLFKEAMKSYTNKLMIGISTAGDNPLGFLANKVKYCKKILDGTVKNESYFVFICEADPSKDEAGREFIDYTNPKVQEMANPSYGQSIRPEDLASDAQEALHDPQQRKDFLAKSLNVFTAQMNTYFDINKVQQSDKRYDWTIDELAKLPVVWYGGADLSKLSDMSAVCLYGRFKGVDICISHAFIPVTTKNRRVNEEGMPVDFWNECGWMTFCNDEVIDYENIVDWFERMRKRGFKIAWVGYDRRYSREFILKMKSKRFKIVDQKQLYVEKTEAFREIEKKIITGQFYYCHNDAFEYCTGNVKTIEDNDDFVRFMKVTPNQRIDMFDAAVIACKQLLVGNEKALKNQAYVKATS